MVIQRGFATDGSASWSLRNHLGPITEARRTALNAGVPRHQRIRTVSLVATKRVDASNGPFTKAGIQDFFRSMTSYALRLSQLLNLERYRCLFCRAQTPHEFWEAKARWEFEVPEHCGIEGSPNLTLWDQAGWVCAAVHWNTFGNGILDVWVLEKRMDFQPGPLSLNGLWSEWTVHGVKLFMDCWLAAAKQSAADLSVKIVLPPP